MRTRGYIVGAAIMTLSFVGALTVHGDFGGRRGGHQHMKHGGDGFPFRILRALDLTEEQQKQVRSIAESHKKTMGELRKELHTINGEVMDKLLASGEEVTTASFANTTARVAALEGQLYKERLAMAVAVRNVLTADQLAKAGELIAKKRALRDERKKSSQPEIGKGADQ